MPSITGTVFISNLNAAPETDVVVRAYGIGLNNRQLLGEVILQAPLRNTSQTFQVRYSTGRGETNIQVQATTLDGLLVGETQIIFNTPDEVTDIRLELRPVENPPSEFERLVSSLTPLIEGVAAADLKPEQISFLARDSRERSSLIALWQEAAILNRARASLLKLHTAGLDVSGNFTRWRWNKTIACLGIRWSARFAAISSLISPTRSTSSWRFSILPATHPAGLN